MERPVTVSAEILTRFHAFVTAQGMSERVDAAQALRAQHRTDLGISSLEVILLVANYMSLRGADTAGFKPEWVVQLDDIAGIVLVMREIDQQVGVESDWHERESK
jgi:hypothetical protein